MTRSTEDLARDVAMVGTPDDWPRWPVLPVKRGDDNRLGVVLAIDVCYAPGRIVVWECNLFTVPTKKNPSGATMLDMAALKRLPHHVYTDATALVDAGWRVD